jgi:hypothetical protein
MKRSLGEDIAIARALLALGLLGSLAQGCTREAPDAHLVEPTVPSEPEPAAEPEPPSGASTPGEGENEGEAQGVPLEEGVATAAAAKKLATATAKPSSTATAKPSSTATAKPSSATKSGSDEPPAPEDEPASPAPAAPKPAEPEPKPKASVRVPSTKHVRVVHGSGMQALLDADSRMQPWVNNVMRVVGSCYDTLRAKSPKAAGSIVVTVTMHKNERPTPDIDSLPPQLSEIVACGTGQLMRGPRMPLFTGPEGQRHRLEIRFTP